MTEARKANAIVRWLTQLVLPLGLAGALLVGVVALGRYLGERGAIVSFREVECEPPEGMTRQQFLEEAEYLAGVSPQLSLVHLLQALTKHPWVLRVKKVQRLRRPGARGVGVPLGRYSRWTIRRARWTKTACYCRDRRNAKDCLD